MARGRPHQRARTWAQVWRLGPAGPLSFLFPVLRPGSSAWHRLHAQVPCVQGARAVRALVAPGEHAEGLQPWEGREHGGGGGRGPPDSQLLCLGAGLPSSARAGPEALVRELGKGVLAVLRRDSRPCIGLGAPFFFVCLFHADPLSLNSPSFPAPPLPQE